MSTVAMSEVGEALAGYQRTLRSVQPRVYFVMRGKRKIGGQIDTWRSRGEPDLRPATHEGVVLLDQLTRE